jgi:hypothetical protein
LLSSCDRGGTVLKVRNLKKTVKATRVFKEVLQDDLHRLSKYVFRENITIKGSQTRDILIGYEGNDKLYDQSGAGQRILFLGCK